MSALPGFSRVVRLGSGGLGDVFGAVRLSTGTPVAIKVLRDWSDGSVAWVRAQRELRALAQLQGHPHVVHLEEVIEAGGVPHLVMEYAPGGSVADVVEERGGPLSVGEVVLVGEQTAAALAASHRLGILHLDIKPQNLLIGAFGQVKVCDFGIAALTQTEQFRDRTNAVSYRYAAPEQLDDGEVGPPADVYALGATLVHVVTGRPLRAGGGDTTVVRRGFGWVRPAGVPVEVGDRLEAVIGSCVVADPRARPAAEDVQAELEAIGPALGPHRPRRLQPATNRQGERLTTLEPAAPASSSPRGHDGGPSAPASAWTDSGTTSSPTIIRTAPKPVDMAAGDSRPPRRWPMVTAIVAVALVAVGALVATILMAGREKSGAGGTTVALSSSSRITSVPSTADSGATPAAPPTTPGPTPSTMPATTLVPTTLAPTTTPSPTAGITTTSIDWNSIAEMELRIMRSRDEASVETLVDWWVPQLSSKRDGIVDEHDQTWRSVDIHRLHEQYNDEYDALTLWSDDFNFNPGLWIAVVPVRFATGQEALQWCIAEGFDGDNCYAKLITRDRSIPGDETAFLQNEL